MYVLALPAVSEPFLLNCQLSPLAALSTHQFFSRSAGVGVLLRAALISSLYRKSVVLSSKSRVTTTNGTLVVHCSSDISRIDFAAGFFHISWTAVVQFVIIVGLLVANLGEHTLSSRLTICNGRCTNLPLAFQVPHHWLELVSFCWLLPCRELP